MYDVIIIGKGPAGLQAALYTARAKLKSLVLGRESVLEKSDRIDNYCCAESQSGEELLAIGVRQAKSVGAEFKEEMVVGITKNNVFEVITDNNIYKSKSVIIATGQPTKKVPIENVDQLEGKGIHYCSTCDGFFYEDMKIGILGFTDYAIQELKEMQEYTKNITLYTNAQDMKMNTISKKYLKEKDISINSKKIQSFEGSHAIEKILFEDKSEEIIDGVFIAYGTASSVDFARKLGVMIQKNTIQVDSQQKTNIDGLFAAGDCTGGFKQISTAVGQGAHAGKSAIEYIKNLKEEI
jgi:thioredoxin reductase (NADPH)